MNQYSTLFLTFKDVGGNTVDSAYRMLRGVIAKICNAQYYLKDSGSVNENDKKVFLQLADTVDGKPTDEQVKTSLALLTRMMYAHYRKPVILLLDSSIRPRGYWKNSSNNAIIRTFIDHTDLAVTQKMEILLAGNYVVQKIESDLTYDHLYSSEDNLWSILYLTGYLTRAREKEVQKSLPQDHFALKIPNAEIKEIFESTIKAWFGESTQRWDRKVLFAAIWNGEAGKVTQEMTRLLRKTISYHDYKEDFYHAFFSGIFAGRAIW